MSALQTEVPTPPRWTVEYVEDSPESVLARPDVLAVFGFGQAAPRLQDPRYLRIALEPQGPAALEVWRGRGPVTHGRDGDIAWAQDGALQFGAIEIDEAAGSGGADGIEHATEAAYRRITAFLATHGYPHVLRMWNYFDDITGGEGDDERYRRFCVGRARAIGAIDPTALPSATAIGRATAGHEQGDGTARRLQVYWLAARTPGTPVENPRQVSAYRYPRQYGPQSPGFARAMLPPAGGAMPLMLSGTAAIVGHESQHSDDVEAQLDEVLANLDSLIGQARAQGGRQPEHFGAGSRLKVYVRDRDDIPRVQAALAQRLPAQVPRIVLHAAVCRRELRVEIDGVHGA